ncbi:MAG: hypothetical protein Q8Q63_13195 [Phaeovulum sp.]|uniref:hypothetical protein n=1 Tax=Phaeovulum sp. TaxID=2934796 RepID=UPI0027364666|nr:hypothetical protein [Phaeovulum sp.]MDP3862529.1 hypothetical protein [Phaeovulum sp.]
MQRASALLLSGLLFGLIVLMGGAMLAKGGLYLGKHEGDTLHLADMVLRMAEAGQWPHLDFTTPIGVLALAPVAFFVWLGAGLGHAVIWAEVAVALLLLLPLARAAGSRFEATGALAYGAYVVVLCLALVHGEANSAVSLSMHYNRWAWAVVYIIVPLAVLPGAGEPRPWLDGALIGFGMAALALIKVTYFVGLAPAILLAFAARGEGRAFIAAMFAGLSVVAALTVLAGPAFWPAYFGDLLSVTQSDTRVVPGMSLAGVVGAPAYLGGSLALLATVAFLRQSDRLAEGLLLLVLTPGFFLITWQNFGNDPQWLVLLAAFALQLRPDPYRHNGLGMPLKASLTTAAVAALAFATPSMLNLAASPFRQAFASSEGMVPLLSARPEHADLLVQETRLYRASALQPLDLPGGPFAAYRDRAERDEAAVLNGETLPECELQAGYSAWFETAAAELVAAGYAGKRILVADLFSSLWLYGPFPPLPGGAAWLYGGAPGIEAAEFVLVPLCPTTLHSRADMLKALAEDGWTLTEARRSASFILLRPFKP